MLAFLFLLGPRKIARFGLANHPALHIVNLTRARRNGDRAKRAHAPIVDDYLIALAQDHGATIAVQHAANARKAHPDRTARVRARWASHAFAS